jgi:hypothetical protein
MAMVLEIDECELSEEREERDFFSQLEDLDSGLADTDGHTDVRLFPPLEAVLMFPGASRGWRFSQPEELPFLKELHQVPPVRPAFPAVRPSRWIVNLTLILLVLLGEAGAVLVFHNRVSHIASQFKSRLR